MSELGSYDEQAKPMDFSPVPGPVWYMAQIEASDVCDTSKNTGQMLNLTWRILEGDCANRVVFDRCNIRNNNPKAQEIGQRQLASIRKATGVNSPKSSEELHGIPCWIKVVIIPEGMDKTGTYRNAKNEVKDYKHASENPSKTSAPAAATQPEPATAAQAKPGVFAGAGAAATPPWKR